MSLKNEHLDFYILVYNCITYIFKHIYNYLIKYMLKLYVEMFKSIYKVRNSLPYWIKPNLLWG